MGDLENYYIVSGTVEYNDDPMHFGRCKCNIPGVIHEDTSHRDAMPWIRPFKMNNFQAFSKPQKGQHVWVMLNKNNYNEMWWSPTHETSPFVNEYLKANYDNQPEIINARTTGQGNAMLTFDDNNGYKISIGNDFINIGMNKSITLKAEQGIVQIKGGNVWAGQGENHGAYQPVVLYNNFNEWCEGIVDSLNSLNQAASSMGWLTGHLCPPISDLIKKFNATENLRSLHFNAN
jgi:hypothetical protein